MQSNERGDVFSSLRNHCGSYPRCLWCSRHTNPKSGITGTGGGHRFCCNDGHRNLHKSAREMTTFLKQNDSFQQYETKIENLENIKNKNLSLIIKNRQKDEKK